jgi:hypothetical protein
MGCSQHGSRRRRAGGVCRTSELSGLRFDVLATGVRVFLGRRFRLKWPPFPGSTRAILFRLFQDFRDTPSIPLNARFSAKQRLSIPSSQSITVLKHYEMIMIITFEICTKKSAVVHAVPVLPVFSWSFISTLYTPSHSVDSIMGLKLYIPVRSPFSKLLPLHP